MRSSLLVLVFLSVFHGSALAEEERTFIRDIHYTLTAADRNQAGAENMALKLVQESIRAELGLYVQERLQVTRKEQRAGDRSDGSLSQISGVRTCERGGA